MVSRINVTPHALLIFALCVLAAAASARAEANAATVVPISGMYLFCYSTPVCLAPPALAFFFNASDLNQGDTAVPLYDAASGSSGGSIPTSGDCSSADFTAHLTWPVGQCTPHPEQPDQSCIASCTPPEVKPFVSIRLLNSPSVPPKKKKEEEEQKENHIARDYSDADIARTLSETYAYTAFNMIINYAFLNQPGVCHTLYNETSSWLRVDSIGSPYYVKASDPCLQDSNKEFKFAIYADSACTNKLQEYSMAPNGTTYQLPVGSLLGITNPSNTAFNYAVAVVECLYISSPTPDPIPVPAPNDASPQPEPQGTAPTPIRAPVGNVPSPISAPVGNAPSPIRAPVGKVPTPSSASAPYSLPFSLLVAALSLVIISLCL